MRMVQVICGRPRKRERERERWRRIKGACERRYVAGAPISIPDTQTD